MKIDLEQIRNLITLVSQSEVTELTIEAGEEKVTIKKSSSFIPPMNIDLPGILHKDHITAPHIQREISFEPKENVPEQGKNQPTVGETSANDNSLVSIASPMVGTFYRSSSPTAPSYVDIGDHIAIGQTVCIIEAMKLMNDLPSEVAGRVVKICVENGSTVEYGQPLFLVDPKA